jgi:predicted lipoprotein with Yx(FWY)xxD motif
MTRKRWFAGIAAIAALALTAAACGGGNAPSSTSGGGGAGTTASTSATVALAKTDLGDVLVDGNGMTVYLFEKDANGKSACSGACASNWPPLTVTGSPTAGSGIDAGKLGTTARPDGTTQVTYNGHPLYLFALDEKPGDTKGEGVDAFGAKWYAVSANGDSVEADSGNSGSGGGYGGYGG